MVIVQHGERAIQQGMVDLPAPNGDTEDDVDQIEQQAVHNVSHGRSHTLAVVEAWATVGAAAGGGGRPFRHVRFAWEVRFEDSLALADGCIFAECLRLP